MPKCYNCLRKLEAHTAVYEYGQPNPGDISVCYYCAAVTKFDEEGNLIPLTKEEFKELEEKESDIFKQITELSDLIRERIKLN